MTTLLTPRSELEWRIGRVQTRLRRDGFDGAIIVGNANRFYLSGTIQQGHLLLPAEGEPLLLIRRDLERARAESALPSVEPLGSLRETATALRRLGLGAVARLGLELDILPVDHFRRYVAALPKTDFHDVARLLRQVRSLKSAFERERQSEAAVQADAALRAGAAALKEGMTESELASVVIGELFRCGHQGLLRVRAFNQEMVFAHAFAGPDAGIASFLDTPFAGRGLTPAVAQGSGRRPIGRSEPVVIDIAGAVDGYLVDQTRTLCLGPLPARFAEGYEFCRNTLDWTRTAARPGVVAGEVYRIAVERAGAAGYGHMFMGMHPKQVSFIGHGIGLEVDELPVIARGVEAVLEEGQVIALEPKLVFPDEGAVGIEDSFVVGPTALEPITISDSGLWEL
ncbi:MAG: Xaa-Pro peptidase family protein [Thermoleophilia bacterium]|nr:Xaa-Pro peptidase family protein [Thermoleophilia bacterium]